MSKLAALFCLFLAAACQTAGGFARGAYSPEYEPLRVELADHLARVVDVAKNDVAAIRDLVHLANAKEPSAGTGALVQRVLLLVALEVATGGQLDVAPAPEGALAALPPSEKPVPRERRRRKKRTRSRRRRRLPPRTKAGRFRRRRRK